MRLQKELIGAVVLGALTLTPLAAQATTVQQAVSEALHSNPQVLRSVHARWASAAALRQAEAGYYPNLAIYGAIGRENTDSPWTRAAGRNGYLGLTRREGVVQLRQNLFDGLATRYTTAAESARVNAAALTVADTANRIALSTVEAYLEVMHRRELVGLTQHFVTLHQALFDRISRRVKGGLSPRADLDQASARLALARADLVAARANLKDAETRYEAAVGTVAPDNLVLPPVDRTRMPATLASALARARELNPGVRAASDQVSAALAARQAANAALMPRIDLVAERDFGDNLDGIRGIDQGYRAMLTLQYNLYNGGADTAHGRALARRADIARDQRDDQRREVTGQVRAAWTAYRSAEARAPELARHAAAAKKTRDAYTEQFQVGRRTLLDLLDSENELYLASRAVIGNRFDDLRARFALLARTGDLVAALNLPMPAETACVGGACLGASQTIASQSVIYRGGAAKEQAAARHRLGGFVFVPKLALSEVHNDNIYATPDNTKADLITVVRPELDFLSHWARHQLNLKFGGNLSYYADHATEKTTDYWGSVSGRRDLSASTKLFAGLTASHLHEDRASPDAENGLSPTLYDDIHGHIGMSHSWGATGLRIAYAHTRLNYDDVRTATGVINNDDRDRNVDSFGARLTFQQDKWFQPFLQATANVRRYDHTPDDNGYVRNSRGDTVVLGVRTELAQLKGEVFGGRLYQRFDDAAFSNVSKPDFGANLSWTPVAKATVRLFASRALDETILSGASSYLYTRSGVGLDYRATERLTLSAGGSWNRVAYQEVARSDTIDTASVGASYAVTPTLKLVAAYDRVHRTSDTPLDNYRDNRWTLQVSAQF